MQEVQWREKRERQAISAVFPYAHLLGRAGKHAGHQGKQQEEVRSELHGAHD